MENDIRTYNGKKQVKKGNTWRPCCIVEGCTNRVKQDNDICNIHKSPKIVDNDPTKRKKSNNSKAKNWLELLINKLLNIATILKIIIKVDEEDKEYDIDELQVLKREDKCRFKCLKCNEIDEKSIREIINNTICANCNRIKKKNINISLKKQANIIKNKKIKKEQDNKDKLIDEINLDEKLLIIKNRQKILKNENDKSNTEYLLDVGKTKNGINQYIFNENDIITLMPKFKYNLYLNAQKSRNNLIMHFLIKDNNKYIKKIKSIKLNEDNKGVDNDKNKKIIKLKKQILNENLDKIVYNSFDIIVKDLLKLTKKELELFHYVTKPPELYNDKKLVIDPYYLGFWLGDGTSRVPTQLTIGKEDQEFICPYFKIYAEKLNLKFHKLNKKDITFNITIPINNTNNDIKYKYSRLNSEFCNKNNNCFNSDWLSEVIKSCKLLEKCKRTLTPHNNFQNNFDIVKEYLNKDDNEYYCNICNYNTRNINQRKNRNKMKSKQDGMREHLKSSHNIILKSSNEFWNKMTNEEKNKWKLCDNKHDICKKSKYCSGVTLWGLYNIYEKEGEQGLKNFQNDKLKRCNTILLNFKKLNLINNKHIPDIFMKSSINDRKKLLAGLIDSDGTSQGDINKNQTWDITLKLKNLIDEVEILAKSLGMYTYKTMRECTATNTENKISRTYYRITITPFNNWILPLLLERKRIINKPKKYPNVFSIIENSSCN